MKFATAILMLCVGTLLALGMVMLYSVGMVKSGAHYMMLQLAWAGAGLVVCWAATCIDYRLWRKGAWLMLATVVILLVLVLVPGIGVYKNGSRRWFNLVVCSFQPSETAKIGLIVFLAYYGERWQRQMGELLKGLVYPGLLVALVLGLVFKEPDRGTTILLAAVSAVLLVLSGVKFAYLVPPAAAALAAMVYSLIHDPVRFKRIVSWLYPEEHKSETGYQAWQAMLALGAGGPTGVGLGNGRQKLGYVPEIHTDFILSNVGEEFGLAGTLSVVALFMVFALCGLYIAKRAKDTFGFLLASGITFLICFQAFINIGVVTSALPNKGLPLPFVSYGGSNLVILLGCVGVLFNIAKNSETAEPPISNQMDSEELDETRFTDATHA